MFPKGLQVFANCAQSRCWSSRKKGNDDDNNGIIATIALATVQEVRSEEKRNAPSKHTPIGANEQRTGADYQKHAIKACHQSRADLASMLGEEFGNP